MPETEVFRLDTKDFDANKCYEFALYTRTTGRWPDEKYYTTNPMKYLGKWISSEEWGWGDNHGGAETFEKHRIVLDYAGKSCFREVPCPQTGGKRKTRRNRKSKKSRKGKSRKNRRKSNRRR